MLDRIFARLQQERMIRLNVDAFSLGSTVGSVHPDGTGAFKKTALSQSANPVAAGQRNFICLPHPLNAP
ncbi:hypothetical protein [Candidatus Electronema sp. TJ]|uniref:hypothetical protein n=1 Tax=Candidatus Electronema sp. TJ TaxID=3401573 RepID=UPI003AA8CFA5